ncbi:hypothetical protein HaLaN_29303, partial [Haematococcus lacustris]
MHQLAQVCCAAMARGEPWRLRQESA